MAWCPQDLPFIIEKSARAYNDMLGRWVPFMDDHPDVAKKMIALMAESVDTLDKIGPLTWFDSDMCDIVNELSKTVPDWSPAACLISPSGMIAFEKPFVTAPYQSEDSGTIDLPISAIVWEKNENSLRVTGWISSGDIPNGSRSAIQRLARPGIEEVLGVTIGIESVVDGATKVFAQDDTVNSRAHKNAANAINSIIGASWLLMSQPRMVEESDSVVAHVKRRAIGSAKKGKVPVRVSVTSLVARRYGGDGSATSDGRRHATTRWWVRGHWRQQAWGKERKLRKPVWIAAHTAGAQDAELDERPQVQVWRTGEK